MYTESTIMFFLGTSKYLFQAKKV
uniref:Uncharacterized protein n=1 Tax=Anguilla anguilla TaxID=7936 RepID=A0A0E9QWW1_ANGAN